MSVDICQVCDGGCNVPEEIAAREIAAAKSEGRK
jgi:hypothetical protein